MNDFPRVARCMPGAEIVSATDRQVKGRVKVSMGPLKLAFGGVIDILEKNDGAHRVVMKATGSEEKGSGRAGGGAPKAMSGFSLMLISAKAFFKNLFKFGKK